MNGTLHPVVAGAVRLSLGMLGAAVLCALVRLLRGPSLPDRVVALDMMSMLAAGIIALTAIESGQSVLLDAILVLALVVFLGTIAFARYFERGPSS